MEKEGIEALLAGSSLYCIQAAYMLCNLPPPLDEKQIVYANVHLEHGIVGSNRPINLEIHPSPCPIRTLYNLAIAAIDKKELIPAREDEVEGYPLYLFRPKAFLEWCRKKGVPLRGQLQKLIDDKLGDAAGVTAGRRNQEERKKETEDRDNAIRAAAPEAYLKCKNKNPNRRINKNDVAKQLASIPVAKALYSAFQIAGQVMVFPVSTSWTKQGVLLR